MTTAPRPRLTLAVTLLMAMLTVMLLSLGSTIVLSNWAVNREFQRLPPEVQEYLRSRREAARNAQLGDPLPSSVTSSLCDFTSPANTNTFSVSGRFMSSACRAGLTTPAPWRTGTGMTGGYMPRISRARDFLSTIQSVLLRVGMLTAVLAALLSWVLSRRLAQPLTEVSRAAQRLAAGDLSARAPVKSPEREVAELALNFNQMAENLQHLETERQQAVTDIAHELRTPIAVMQARLDALEDGIYPLDTAQVSSLSQQTQLLSRLVDDLRTLTLAEAGQLRLQKESVDLVRLCRGLTNDLQARAQAQHVHLTFKVSGLAQAAFEGDSDRLKQIVLNLLENALRHSRTNVLLTLQSAATGYDLHVDDDGPGIPEEARQRVFTRFTRLDPSRTRGTGGSGLGLAIVRAFVQAHGGSIRVSSGPLGGARMTVSLPVNANHTGVKGEH